MTNMWGLSALIPNAQSVKVSVHFYGSVTKPY